EQRVRLEHGLVRPAEGWELEQMIHDPDGGEAAFLPRRRQLDDASEELRVGDAEGEVRQLQPEAAHRRGRYPTRFGCETVARPLIRAGRPGAGGWCPR